MISLFFALIFLTIQTTGDEIVRKARTKLGCSYKYGASGISIPRTAAQTISPKFYNFWKKI